jgi:hypothetical protein
VQRATPPRGVAALSEAWRGARALGSDDARMGAMWRLQGGRDIMAMPRAAFVRAMLNHW